MKFETPDGNMKKLKTLSELFPGVVADGKVNFELLRSMLCADVTTEEAYEFTWVGKRAAITEAGRPVRKTLRPCVSESKNWETTQNIYIEGDNLDVLKLLQESYLDKIKLIYIDPPYNTGSDFIYRDNFAQSREEFDKKSGVYGRDGERLFRNTESNGRFHSDWCSMIYPRLVLARNMLRSDGVIFISIDDGEASQLRAVCNEVFGESNFIACVIWERAFSPINLKKHFSTNHDYVLCYAKSITEAVCNGLRRSNESDDRYKNPDNDPRGAWASGDLSVGPVIDEKVYEITTPGGRSVMPPSGRCWVYTKDRYEEMLSQNRIWFGKNGNSVPMVKKFLNEVKQSITPMTIWKHTEVGHSKEATQSLKKLFDGKDYFDYPKSVKLIKQMIELYTSSDNGDIVMDFFSGSATTAHAVMQLNAEDGGRRSFIMVQLPEPCPDGTEAAKGGYANICEIGKERIRRAGEMIKRETEKSITGGTGINYADIEFKEKAKLDIGFRVFKLDETNMNDVYYAAGDYTQDLISKLEANIKPDRTDMDLLFGCLLEWGLPLSSPHFSEKIDGFTVHMYNDIDLIACFEDSISEKAVRDIARRKPLRVVFRDNCFKNSLEKIDVLKLFKLLTPGTNVKVV